MDSLSIVIIGICAAVVVITIIIAIILLSKKKKEGFVTTSQGAYIDPVTGAIKGPGIMTDGMTQKPWNLMKGEVETSGRTSDNTETIGVGLGNGFSQLYQNQKDIDEIDKRASEGMFSLEDLSKISGKIASAENNASNNLYTKGKSVPVRAILAPNEIRGVIDEKYLPERDKNRQIATVSAIINIPGYDINTERIGVNLSEVHFSTLSSNKKKNREPTAAGATGGGKVDLKGLVGTEPEISANQQAVRNNINVQGDKITIVRGTDSDGNKQIVTIPTERNYASNETFGKKYAFGNTRTI